MELVKSNFVFAIWWSKDPYTKNSLKTISSIFLSKFARLHLNTTDIEGIMGIIQQSFVFLHIIIPLVHYFQLQKKLQIKQVNIYTIL